MLQIPLNKGTPLDGGTGVKSLLGEIVTVTCRDHLILADLPVANGLASSIAASNVKMLSHGPLISCKTSAG